MEVNAEHVTGRDVSAVSYPTALTLCQGWGKSGFFQSVQTNYKAHLHNLALTKSTQLTIVMIISQVESCYLGKPDIKSLNHC